MIGYDEQGLTAVYQELNNIIKDMVSIMKDAKTWVSKMDSKEHWDGEAFNYYNSKFKAIVDNFAADTNDIYKLNNNITTVISRYTAANAQATGYFNSK